MRGKLAFASRVLLSRGKLNSSDTNFLTLLAVGSYKIAPNLRFTDPKQKIQVEVQGNNLNFLLSYTPQP